MFKLLVIISFEELTLTNETQKEFKLIGIMFGVICELKGTQFHPHILPCELWTQPNKSSNRTTSQFGVLYELE